MMMKRINKILLIVATVILVLPSFLVTASTNDSKKEQVPSIQNGEYSSKDEVVYATLSPNGDRKEIYVVNTFEVTKSGMLVDYGSYSTIRNLTDLSDIDQTDDKVQFTAPEGKFYYQGNMKDAPLPWDFSISYFLDGKEITPEKLAGQSGNLQIAIESVANDKVDKGFFENYLLQISLSLNTEITSNITAENGMMANAGKNKQVTFTVMPEKEEKQA